MVERLIISPPDLSTAEEGVPPLLDAPKNKGTPVPLAIGAPPPHLTIEPSFEAQSLVPKIKDAAPEPSPLIQANTNMRITNAIDPAKEARLNKLAKKYALPMALLRGMDDATLTMWENKTKLEAAAQAGATSTVNSMAQNPKNAVEVRDSVAEMAVMENAISLLPPPTPTDYIEGLGYAAERGWDRLMTSKTVLQAQSSLETAQDIEAGRTPMESFFSGFVKSIQSVADSLAFVIDDPQERTNLVANSPLAYILGINSGLSRAGRREGTDEKDAVILREQAESYYKEALKRTLAMQGKPMSDRAQRFMSRVRPEGELDDGIEKSLSDELVVFMKAMVADPIGFGAMMSEIGLEFAPVLGAGAATTLITRTPAAGMAIATAGTFVTEAYQLPLDYLKKRHGVDLNTEKGFNTFVHSPDIQRDVERFGSTRGAYISAFQLLGIGAAGRIFSKNPFINTLIRATIQSGADFIGETGAQLSSEGVVVWMESILEAALGPATLPVDIAIATVGHAKKKNEAVAAKKWLETGNTITETLKKTPTAVRDMATAADILGEKLESQGVTEVFIDAKALIDFEQSATDEGGDSVLATLGLSSESVHEAALDANTVRIDATGYVRHILGVDGFNSLIEHTKTEAEGMTPAEAKRFEETGEADLEAEVERLQTNFLKNVGLEGEALVRSQDDASSIHTSIRDQLVDSGQVTVQQAELYALLKAQRYTTRAIRASQASGAEVRALDLYLRDAPKIVGPEFTPAQLKAGDVDFEQLTQVELTKNAQAIFDSLSEQEKAQVEKLADRLKLPVKDVIARSPLAVKASRELIAGTITQEDWNSIIDKYKPVTPFENVPSHESDDAILRGLAEHRLSNKKDAALKATLLNADIADAIFVGLRLDIPSYKNEEVWTVTVHEADPTKSTAQAGTPLSYQATARVVAPEGGKVKLSVMQPGARKYVTQELDSKGKPHSKSTFATIRGNYASKGTTEQTNKDNEVRAKEALNTKGWVQVGMDPERHSYFYDRSDHTRAIVEADEVIQVGALVLAKNPVYATPVQMEEFLFQAPRPSQVDMRIRQLAFENDVRSGQVVVTEDNIVEVNQIREAAGLETLEVGHQPIAFDQDAVPDTGNLTDHLLRVDRGRRQKGQRVTWEPGERERIAANAEEVGVEASKIEAHVRKRKLAHPASAGWTPWVYNRTVVVEQFDKDGNVIPGIPGLEELDHQPLGQGYTFNTDNDGNAIVKGSKDYNRRVTSMARKVRDEVLGIYRRSLNNKDNAALAIIRQAGWYKNMRVRLRREFGGLGDLFADLLGATSPNTPVRGNWDGAIEALQLASQGKFDVLLPKWLAWSDNIERVQGEFKQWMAIQVEQGAIKVAKAKEALDAAIGEGVAAGVATVEEAQAALQAHIDTELATGKTKTEVNKSDAVKVLKADVKAARKAGSKGAVLKSKRINKLKVDVKTARKEASKATIKESDGWIKRKEQMSKSRELPEALLPKKRNGNNYGFNGRNVVRAMVDLWRVVKNADADIALGGTKPKALNFSGNLIGFRKKATIDVWAARLLQRLVKGNRIPSEAEQSVRGDMLESGETTAQFGLGQDVFEEAASLIRSDPEMSQNKDLAATQDDDLQAIVWFLEKERWAKDDATSAAGEGGSFEFEADLAGIADRARITEIRKIIDSKLSTKADREAAAKELDAIKREADRFYAGVSIQQSLDTQGIDFLPTDGDMAVAAEELRTAIYEEGGEAVIASKAFSTEGRYGDSERAFDVEIVGKEDYDPTPLWNRIREIGRRSRQDSVFLSRVLRAGEEVDPLTHRPGVEVYFKDMKSLGEVQPILDELAAEGLSFYTVIVDGRRTGEALRGEVPNAVGVRLQYVPEFDARYPEWADTDFTGELSDTDIPSIMEAQAEAYGVMADTIMQRVSGVNFAGTFWYETNVEFLHEYEGAQDADTEGIADRTAGRPDQKTWKGRTVREGVAAANRQRGETERSDAPARQPTEDIVLDQAVPEEGELQQDAAQGPRGRFIPSDTISDQDGNPINIIQIFETGDRTTFLHESGHFWLEQLKSDAAEFGGELKVDFDTVTKWWGDNADSIRAEALDRARKKKDTVAVKALSEMSDAKLKSFVRSGNLRGEGHERFISVAMHEQWARGTENYFRTGEAPSLALADAFVRFAAWMKSVYRSMLRTINRDGLDIKFSPEVKEVLDRMLASDQEIETTASQFNLVAMFETAEQAGMTKEKFATYQRDIARAREAAKARQTSKRIKEIERQRLDWWKNEREALRGEVESELASRPAHRLIWTLAQGGLADGSTAVKVEKLGRIDRAGLLELMTKEELNALPKAAGRTIFETSTKKHKAVSPGVAAQVFGFDSVQQMIEVLKATPDFKESVEAELDRRMVEEHGTLEDDAATEAIASIHEGDDVGRMLSSELSALRTSEKAFSAKFVRAYAIKQLLKTSVRDLNPGKFLAAEKKHATAAGRALKAGNRAEAYKHKFQQRLNHIMAREAIKLQKKLAKDKDYLVQFKSKRRKFPAVDADYIDRIQIIMDGFTFGPRMSERTKLKKELAAINEWIEKKKTDDQAILDLSSVITEQEDIVDYRDMPLGDFDALVDGIKVIEKQGRLKKKLLLGQELLDRNLVVAKLLTALRSKGSAKNVKERGKHIDAQESKGMAQWAAGIDATLLKLEMLFELIDGTPLGPWHQAFYQPFADAEALKQDLNKQVADLIHERIQNLPKKVRKALGKRIDVGVLALEGEEWTRGNLIMLALNVGNESNRDKVIRGEKEAGRTGISEETIDEALEHLTKEEWEFVQAIWDHSEKLFPEVERIYRRENGRGPLRIEPREISNDHGTFRGGYFPLMYDHTRSQKADDINKQDALEAFQSENVRASVNSSVVKERVQAFAAPVDFSINRLGSSFERTIHFISHYEAVQNAKKLLADPALIAEMQPTLGPAYINSIKNWVGHIAANGQDRPPVSGIEAISAAIARNTTVATLGFSYTTMAAQLLGYTAAFDRLLADTTYGPVSAMVALKDIGLGLSQALSKKHRDAIFGLSGEMRHRLRNTDRDLRAGIRAVQGKAGLKARVEEYSMLAIGAMQLYTVDLPVWSASYNRALRAEPDNVQGAINYADRVVRISQSAGGLKDLADIQRDKGAMKVFTMFYSFFSVLYAILRQVGHEVVLKNPRSIPRAMARILILLTLQEIGYAALRGKLPDLDPEDEEEDALLTWAAKKTVLAATGTVPLLRDMAEGVMGDYGYKLSPIASFGDSLVRSVDAAADALDYYLNDDTQLEEPIEFTSIKPIMKTLGVLLRLPTNQPSRTLDGLLAIMEEEEGSSLFDLLVGFDEEQAKKDAQ